MAYTLDYVVTLGPAQTGLTLLATLLDTSGATVSGQIDISTGFVELFAGTYQWHYEAFPDGHRGAVVFHTGAWAGTPVKRAAASINPQEAENLDAKVSTRSTYSGGAVASVTDKTGYSLTSDERNSIADAILKRDWTAVTGEAARSMLNALRFLRNKWTKPSTTLTVYKEDDTTEAWTGTATVDEDAANLTGVDPS